MALNQNGHHPNATTTHCWRGREAIGSLTHCMRERKWKTAELVSYNTEQTHTIRSSTHAPTWAENLCLHKTLHTDVYSSCIPNWQNLEAIRCPSVGEWINKLYLIQSWLVWLSGLSTGLWIERSPVQFPVRAHAWVLGHVPSWGAWEKHAPLSLKTKKWSLKKNKL